MNFILPLLIVAQAGAAPIEPRFPAEAEVFHCDFGESWDKNYDHWPDGWDRIHRDGFPSYLKIELTDEPVPTGGRCLLTELDGGAAAVVSPPIDVSLVYSYVVEAVVKTEGLEHDRAFLSLSILNKKREELETFYSQKVRDTHGWCKVRLGPVWATDRDARFAVIGLHVEPQGRADLTGSARFTDIWMARLPRLNVELNSANHTYGDPSGVEVRCEASGFTDPDQEAEFELADALGATITRLTRKLHTGPLLPDTMPAAKDWSTEPPLRGTSLWKPPIREPGFYHVRIRLPSKNGLVQTRELALAVLAPVQNSVAGEFGWSLPQGDRPIPLAELGHLISQAGVNWVKYPLWFDPETPEQDIERLILFGERLNTQGIELVGMLSRPPEKVCKRFGGQPVMAADVFSASADVWYPSLEGVLMRLMTRVRWWQIGGDDDTSFVGYPGLAARIAQVKQQLDRVGQDVNLGLVWDWLFEAPPRDDPPWRFLALSTVPPLTAEEVSAYLAADAKPSVQRWVSIKPLRRDRYSFQVRAIDLVRRMMAAKMHQADAVFLTDPFDPQTGVMNPDGTAGELFLPWRTTALALRGSRYLGSIQLPEGSHNQIFAQGDTAVMVVWNERPVREVLHLGRNARQIDVWGRSRPTPDENGEQVVQVGPMPSFVTGLNKGIALWRMSFAFDHEQLPSIFGRKHANKMTIKNAFARGVSGSGELIVPGIWSVEPSRVTFRMDSGESQGFPFEILLPYHAANGRHRVRIDFEVFADRPYRFSVYRHMDLGFGDVYVKIATRLNDDGELEVEQRFVNETDGRVSFDCELFAPDRKRLKTQVRNVLPGEDVQIYRLRDGEELTGKTLWLRATEIGGPRILNYRFVVRP